MLVDDHVIICKGLASLFENQPDMEVIAEAQSGYMAIELSKKLKPDVILMDISMPKMNGINASRKIIANNSDIKIIALSVHSNYDLVMEMLNAGAAGYILKDCAFDDVIKAVKAVMNGESYLSPSVAKIVIEQALIETNKYNISPNVKRLTYRESEILQLIAENHSTKEIAQILHISPKTAATHRQKIMDKLNCHSVVELVKYAIQKNIISIDKI